LFKGDSLSRVGNFARRFKRTKFGIRKVVKLPGDTAVKD